MTKPSKEQMERANKSRGVTPKKKAPMKLPTKPRTKNA